MLFSYAKDLCRGALLFMLFAMACAGYAYYINARRAADDPKKRNYHPVAIVFAPITLPVFVIFAILIFIMRVLLYGVFLVLFAAALIVVRKPVLLAGLAKIATFVGNKLLDANTTLIKLFMRAWAEQPENI